MKRKVPRMTTDRQAKAFLAKDLSDLEFSQFKPARFEFDAKSGQLNMRLPEALLDAIKQRAAARGIPYTKFVRQVLEAELAPETEVPRGRAGSRASVGAKSGSRKSVDAIVRAAARLPAHQQDALLGFAEILNALPADMLDKALPALQRIAKAIGHDQAGIRRLSEDAIDVRKKLRDMADQNKDIARENRELKGRVDGLTVTVADQGNQNKQLQDRLRVLHESFSRAVAARAPGALAVSSERH
jgi:predicted DNA binding CopG/RHH family protein